MSSVVSRLPEPELPPSPPCEQTVQRSLQEGTEYPPVPMYETGRNTVNSAAQGNEGHEQGSHPMAPMMYESTPPVYWQQSVPTSYPMEVPTQEVATPTDTNEDESSRLGSSSPSWSPSPQRRAKAPRAKRAKSPRERRTRARKGPGSRANSGIVITAPMSQSTLHLDHIPLRDMYAWAHRSEEDRRAQAEKKQSIPRPMNAFMMYRLAYSNRAKELLNVKNYQIVNTAIADSWNMETDEVKNFYNEMSKIERDNHQRTHPTYKFRPNRGPAFTARAVNGPMTPPQSCESFESDSVTWSDGEYGSPRMFHHHHERSQSLYSDYSRDSTPFEYNTLEQNGYPAWNSYPSGTGLPTIQSSALQGGIGSQVEDIHYHCPSPVPTKVQYDLSNGLTGLPGSTHELLQSQAQSISSHVAEGGNLDPQMLTFPEGQGMNMTPAFAPVANPYPVWGEEDSSSNCYLTSSSQSISGTASPGPSSYHQMASSYPMQRNPSWDASQHDMKEIADAWIDM